MTNYTELIDSQQPALTLLQKLGWQYISPEQAEQERRGLLSNVILEQVLEKQLHEINDFEYKGKTYKFSQSSIQSAINSLKNIPDEGLVRSNEQVYDLLTLGRSFVENIQGDQKAFTLRFIDWETVQNNVFHVTEEYAVEGIKNTRRPDMVLFVNGIPFVMLENKRRDKNASLEEAISQHLRNQRKDQGAPRIFHFAQLLLAVQPNLVKYAVTGTPLKFWSVWKEDNQNQVAKILQSKVYGTAVENRLATQQDQAILSLCEPQRLMELVYQFMVFDGPEKKVARYQQYFAVKEALHRIKQTDQNGIRKGGVIWHTQGSGKSLTMVMLSKSIALDPEIKDPRIIIVTDRISLDKQIYKTFLNCGKNVKKARSGNDLIELLKDKGNENITSIVDKFQTALKRKDFTDTSGNLFVLVDESHRGQYGSAHAKMKSMLPNASYIGFTGTPLLKSEKSTARKFGGFIHKYTIDQAVADEAVLPLLYEGRSAKLSVNRKQLDKGFERLSAPLSEEAQKDLKRKFASISKIYESEQVVEEIAYDISKHFCENWQGTGFKAQLAVPKIDTAIRYQKYFENQTDPALKINSRVVFTPPDSRSDYSDVWAESSSEAKSYWNNLMDKFRGQEDYENHAVERFKDKSNQNRYAEVVSYKEYEPRVRKLLDTYVGADYVERLTGEVNIFDQNRMEDALETYGKTPASKADMIAHQMKKVIHENMEKDEAYYKKFSELIEATIQAFREGRMDEKEYLEKILRTRSDLQAGYQEGLPGILSDKKEARAFYGALTEVLVSTREKEEIANIKDLLAQAGIQISEMVEKLTIRDWKRNIDVQNKMENAIEDYLIDHRKTLGLEITFDEIDDILAKCLKVAKNNY